MKRADLSPLTQKAYTPIKINLALHVTGQLKSGHHKLESIALFAKNGDEVEICPSPTFHLNITGPYSGRLSQEDFQQNLVYKAYKALSEHYRDQAYPVTIHLKKNLPLASGIGAGSGDCAQVLVLLKKLWQLDLGLDALSQMGAKMGADIPACLYALEYHKPLLMQGIGDDIGLLTKLPQLNLVLVNDGTPLATKDIFNHLQNKNQSGLPDCDRIETLADVLEFLKHSRNDLYQPAISRAPHIGRVHDVLLENGALFARMSGSGATFFGLFARFDEAQKAAATIKACQPDWYVQALQTEGIGHE